MSNKMSKQFKDLFNFSEEVIVNIREAYHNFLKESKKIGKKSHLSKEKREIITKQFVMKLVDKALNESEKKQEIKYSKKIRKEFEEKIIDIITSDTEEIPK